MDKSVTNQSYYADQKEFWDSLQAEILISNQKLTQIDIMSLVEQSFMFSMFFRGCSQLELIGFQTLLNIKDNGYIILVDLSPSNGMNYSDFEIDEFTLHRDLKELLHNTNCTIGPLISNRISILISNDSNLSNIDVKCESLNLSDIIIATFLSKYRASAVIGIGSVQSLHSVYTSFIEALSCLRYSKPGQGIHILDLDTSENNNHFDNIETEKYMLDALRLRKVEAYDYFGMMMDWIRPLNDEGKRNKILELLVMTNHMIKIDHPSNEKYFNYMGHVKELQELKGIELIEWAFQRFIYITGYVKPQNSIDYSNRIVQLTKEYLENHYSEDISLEDVAEQVNISPQYFSKLIKKTTGFNFIDWLSMLRVKKAKELLTNSNLTVKEVCFMVGYKDPNYFSRIFKKRIGITPSEYVKNSVYLNNKN